MVKIACIINYCTNDYRFLSACIEGVGAICSEIIVTVCDHFFDGVPEDRELLHRSYSENQSVRFIEFAFDHPYGLWGGAREGKEAFIRHFHNAGRYIGMAYLETIPDYVLFVDCDEIGIPSLLESWVSRGEFTDAMLFSSYVYCGHEGRRGKWPEHAWLMVHYDALEPEMLFHSYERRGLFSSFKGRKACVTGLKGEPMVHHYNWVRTPQELYRKVISWGHSEERDWDEVLKRGNWEEVTGLQYDHVPPSHQFLTLNVESLRRKNQYQTIDLQKFSNVQYTNPQKVLEKRFQKDFF